MGISFVGSLLTQMSCALGEGEGEDLKADWEGLGGLGDEVGVTGTLGALEGERDTIWEGDGLTVLVKGSQSTTFTWEMVLASKRSQ